MDPEVLIIGGGVIGLSIARELRLSGVRRITIIDSGKLAAEASWAAAGMLAPDIETDATDLFHRFGTESLAHYPDLADSLLDETGIDIGLDRSGTLCPAFSEREAAELHETYERQKVRPVVVDHLSKPQIIDLEPSISSAVVEGLFYLNNWQVDNRKLTEALKRSAEISGINVIEDTQVTDVRDQGHGAVAVTSGGSIGADLAILATGAWTSLIKIPGAQVPVKPIRGQMLSFASGDRVLDRVVYSSRGYLVPRADGRILAGATVEDVGFDKSTTAGGIEELKAAAVEIIPGLARSAISETWAGLRPFAADGLPILGNVPGCENVAVATAHYRNGILLAPMTARIIAEKVVRGEISEYLQVFGADRFASAAARADAN